MKWCLLMIWALPISSLRLETEVESSARESSRSLTRSVRVVACQEVRLLEMGLVRDVGGLLGGVQERR